MIEIVEQSKEFNKVEKYLMTQSKGAVLLKDIEDGTSIDVTGYIVYAVTKNGEDTKELLSLITANNEVFTTISATFKEEFRNIWNMFESIPTPIVKASGTTKSGRTYITCMLDITKVM